MNTEVTGGWEERTELRSEQSSFVLNISGEDLNKQQQGKFGYLDTSVITGFSHYFSNISYQSINQIIVSCIPEWTVVVLCETLKQVNWILIKSNTI